MRIEKTYFMRTLNTKGETLGFSKIIIPFSFLAHRADNAFLK